MPIYEYKCQECGTHIEKMQKISDAPLTVCENCGGKLEKQVSRSGFQLKGEGWYVTEYAGKGKPATGASPKTETKTESSESSDNSEKSSAAESTAKTDSASKPAETKTASEK